MFENRVLRRTFGPKRNKEIGEWRKLHNEELNDLYCSPNILWMIKWRRVRWAGHVARMGNRRYVYWVEGERSDGKGLFGRPWRRWEDLLKLI